jgi:hypothetical protein
MQLLEAQQAKQAAGTESGFLLLRACHVARKLAATGAANVPVKEIMHAMYIAQHCCPRTLSNLQLCASRADRHLCVKLLGSPSIQRPSGSIAGPSSSTAARITSAAARLTAQSFAARQPMMPLPLLAAWLLAAS